MLYCVSHLAGGGVASVDRSPRRQTAVTGISVSRRGGWGLSMGSKA